MNLRKHISVLVLCFVSALSSSAKFEYGGLMYEINEDDTTTARVVAKWIQWDPQVTQYENYGGSLGDVVISPYVIKDGNYYKVTGIGHAAFGGVSINSLTIPFTVEHIAPSAFQSYGYSAEPGPIGDCIIRTFIKVPSLDWWLNVDFDGVPPKSYDLYAGGELVEDLELPEEIDSLRDYCFSGCKSLKSINLPNSIKSIGYGAFMGSGVENIISLGPFDYIGESMFRRISSSSINVPEGIKTIENYAFAECNNLDSISLPGSIRKISSYSFYKPYKSNTIKSVSVPDIETWCKLVHEKKECNDRWLSVYPIMYPDGGDLYTGNTKVENLVIPNSIDSIYSNAFTYVNSIKKAQLGSSVKWIGPKSFYYCYLMDTLELSNSIEEIGDQAFYMCYYLKNLVSYIRDPQSVKIGFQALRESGGRYAEIDRTLWVPKGTIEKYKAHPDFYGYGSIREIADSDVNGDYIADVRDVTAIINAVLIGTDTNQIGLSGFKLYDVNHDGEVDVKDVTYAIGEVLGRW